MRNEFNKRFSFFWRICLYRQFSEISSSWSHFSFWFYLMSFSHFAYHSRVSFLSSSIFYDFFLLLLYCLHLFFFLYFIYPSDSVETYSCCAMFILFMMRVYFILFNLLVWRSTNTNCEYFMNGKSSFRIKLFLWFDFQHT